MGRNGTWLAAGLTGLAAAVAAEGTMIEAGAAREAAQRELAAVAGDPPFAAWAGLTLGAPLAVGDVAGVPAYWLVPVEAAGRAVGFVRVGADGRVAAVGVTCRTPDDPAACPVPLFAMTAAAVAAAVPPPAPGETLDAPRLVHEGPPGREVWLTEVRRDGIPVRWVFTGRGGSYERPAGWLGDPAVE